MDILSQLIELYRINKMIPASVCWTVSKLVAFDDHCNVDDLWVQEIVDIVINSKIFTEVLSFSLKVNIVV